MFTFRFNIDDPFHNSDLVLPLNFDLLNSKKHPEMSWQLAHFSNCHACKNHLVYAPNQTPLITQKFYLVPLSNAYNEILCLFVGGSPSSSLKETSFSSHCSSSSTVILQSSSSLTSHSSSGSLSHHLDQYHFCHNVSSDTFSNDLVVSSIHHWT